MLVVSRHDARSFFFRSTTAIDFYNWFWRYRLLAWWETSHTPPQLLVSKYGRTVNVRDISDYATRSPVSNLSGPKTNRLAGVLPGVLAGLVSEARITGAR